MNDFTVADLANELARVELQTVGTAGGARRL
jgi:hypothetical protein